MVDVATSLLGCYVKIEELGPYEGRVGEVVAVTHVNGVWTTGCLVSDGKLVTSTQFSVISTDFNEWGNQFRKVLCDVDKDDKFDYHIQTHSPEGEEPEVWVVRRCYSQLTQGPQGTYYGPQGAYYNFGSGLCLGGGGGVGGGLPTGSWSPKEFKVRVLDVVDAVENNKLVELAERVVFELKMVE